MIADSALFSALDAMSVQLEPSDPPTRIVAGAPQCAERVLVLTAGVEIGVWEVTAGRFLSTKPDSGEVMHFLAGSGTLSHPDGSVTNIGPGVTVSLRPGWSGEWNVTETVRKVYAIYAQNPTAPTN
ncbi:cupin domain-containing protein [Mycolicibacterium komossense]|uniref:DUF861 domain-containing protein n=1 Tax=Mycolicibacterium komossense TaxID=1779 RepID=A0ABT3C7C8_9MYCO|nr:cupin domain-containing protein [Mycolicibacterium komossense]MCV7225387.1 DUF861 domain-containing protein [Mycolicibacterium komossense]